MCRTRKYKCMKMFPIFSWRLSTKDSMKWILYSLRITRFDDAVLEHNTSASPFFLHWSYSSSVQLSKAVCDLCDLLISTSTWNHFMQLFREISGRTLLRKYVLFCPFLKSRHFRRRDREKKIGKHYVLSPTFARFHLLGTPSWYINKSNCQKFWYITVWNLYSSWLCRTCVSWLASGISSVWFGSNWTEKG